MSDRRGRVYLVGAGPGAFDLITLRGAECLRKADCVIYDYLVNPDLLQLAPPTAELIFAGKRSGAGRVIDQSALNTMLIKRARRGQKVVRLKGGDPFIFGRGGEEAEALARAKISFEVVPGITSAIAAPAFAGIPLTHRRHGSFVAFVTGHEDESRRSNAGVPWGELARAARRGGTIVLLMATARMRTSLQSLVKEGLPAKIPAAAVQWGTTAAQKTVLATVGTLAKRCADARLQAPAVIVIGDSANLRGELRWFEKMPLFGRRIVVTRSRDAAQSFARELRALGADAIEFPTIETAPPSSFRTLDRAIEGIDRFDWIIFTSATGVEAFVQRIKFLHRDIRALGRASLCAIGSATAAQLEHYGLTVAAVPSEYRAEAIISAIGQGRIRTAQILIPRAQVAREILPKLLLKQGAREVLVAPAYRTVKPAGGAAARIRSLLTTGDIDLVAFTSSSTVSNFCDLVGRNLFRQQHISRRQRLSHHRLKAAAIGPITAKTAREAGFKVVVSPKNYTVPALIDAIRRHFQRPS